MTLVSAKDYKLDSGLSDCGQAYHRQRHIPAATFLPGMPEAKLEILDTPGDLQVTAATIEQRQNRMVVGLRNRIAMAVIAFAR